MVVFMAWTLAFKWQSSTETAQLAFATDDTQGVAPVRTWPSLRGQLDETELLQVVHRAQRRYELANCHDGP